MPRAFTGSIAVSRVIISLAALFVKVTASTPPGDTRPFCSSQAMRVVSTRVLPEPAPAKINACSLGNTTAASCSGLRFCNSGELGAGLGVALDMRAGRAVDSGTSENMVSL